MGARWLPALLCGALWSSGALGHRMISSSAVQPDMAEMDPASVSSGSGASSSEPDRAAQLRQVAVQSFQRHGLANYGLGVVFAKFNRSGSDSVFEQTRQFFCGKGPIELVRDAQLNVQGWQVDWSEGIFLIRFAGEEGVDANGLRREWIEDVLESVVIPDKSKTEGLQCLKSGKCESTASPQYLFEALPSGNLIPILGVDRQVDKSWTGWIVGGIAGAVGFDQTPAALQRFHFLGKWMARAYVISGLGYAPASFHEAIYTSLIAGEATLPSGLSALNAYKEVDTIEVCEKIVSIVGRRPQEMGTYGWKSCDEVKDPETGRYMQESCYVPLYRSAETWEYLYSEWGDVAPKGVTAKDLVPFARAREYTALVCQRRWENDLEAPMTQIAQGFRSVISNATFWEKADAQSLRQLIEGEPEVNVTAFTESIVWDWNCQEHEKQVAIQTLHELAKKNHGVPPVEHPLNKLLRFFTGSFKEPVGGFSKGVPTIKVNRDGDRCVPLVGKTCFYTLYVNAACLVDTATFEDIIMESVVVEGYGLE